MKISHYELSDLIYDVMRKEISKVTDYEYSSDMKDKQSQILGIQKMAKALKDSIEWGF